MMSSPVGERRTGELRTTEQIVVPDVNYSEVEQIANANDLSNPVGIEIY